MDNPNENIIIIGAGPAGLMASIAAAEHGGKVVLLEKNGFPGRKLSITGKGRCNITNTALIDQLILNIPGNGKFLFSTFNKFSNSDLIEFLASQAGIQTVSERGGRVFPVSNDAKDVTSALVSLAKKRGVEIMTNSEVSSIDAIDGAVVSVTLKNGRRIGCNSAVLATGGASYKNTGSTGDGYSIARTLGHTVIPPEPSLVPLISSEAWVGSLAGLALKNIAIKLVDEKMKTIYTDFGEMLFTHNGVSGPVILSASRHMVGRKDRNTTLIIDLKPALSGEVLDKRIIRDFTANPNKAYKNSLEGLLPKSLISVVIMLSGIDPEKPVNMILKAERQSLASLLKNLRVPITGTGSMNEAIITAGGIKTSEINPATLESKLVKGLYFAGEVIDVDAYTGGFNLTIAFCTGYCSGLSVNYVHAPTKGQSDLLSRFVEKTTL